MGIRCAEVSESVENLEGCAAVEQRPAKCIHFCVQVNPSILADQPMRLHPSP
jgi:hypothetical protein